VLFLLLGKKDRIQNRRRDGLDDDGRREYDVFRKDLPKSVIWQAADGLIQNKKRKDLSPAGEIAA